MARRVHVESGELEAQPVTASRSLGVPYAAPATRFRPPEPPSRWRGVRPAVRFGPAPQPGSLRARLVVGPLAPLDAACLVLTGWAPGSSGCELPEMEAAGLAGDGDGRCRGADSHCRRAHRPQGDPLPSFWRRRGVPGRIIRRRLLVPDAGCRPLWCQRSYGSRRVSTRGASSVMAIVCSEWAVREPSAERMVQPSAS
ncbi:carboxylesterase family protein [Amycolatopsis sp. FDAARGOS 1241]|nr:carboxylesterase family protein [Amycolatopsis sp. FDAARGOS 1241]QRP50319.1 carboxylesterase family protein [Amycolatopsis sp. FDAARGOS 1241]